MKIDLHLHSQFSDGSDSLEEVIEKAKKNDVTHLSFVDHDTVETFSYVLEHQLNRHINYIPGVEISAYDFIHDKKVHILGYNYEFDAKHIRSICKEYLEKRNQLSLDHLDRLSDHGYEVDETVIERQGNDPVLYRQHLMYGLTHLPYNHPDYQKLYKKLFKKPGALCGDDIEYIDVFTAVRAIKADYGIAVLAHPGQFDNYDIVKELVDEGLDGIERFHPDHQAADHRRVEELAKEFRLLQTGGSDYHGYFWQKLSPGEHTAPEEAEILFN